MQLGVEDLAHGDRKHEKHVANIGLARKTTYSQDAIHQNIWYNKINAYHIDFID
jgi:hypothetical protein